MTPDGGPAATGSDHEQLRALLQRYARAADAHDVGALRSLFVAGATVTGARGTLDLDAWLATMAPPSTFPSSMHVLADPLIDLDGDQAQLDTYAVVFQLGDQAAGQGDLTLGIRYRDRAERTAAGWAIAERVAETRWMR